MTVAEIYDRLPSAIKTNAKTYAEKYSVGAKNYEGLQDNIDQQYGEYWNHPRNYKELGEGYLVMLKSEPDKLYMVLSNTPTHIPGQGISVATLDLHALNVEGASYQSSLQFFPVENIPVDLVALHPETAKKMKVIDDEKEQAAKLKQGRGRPLGAAKKSTASASKPVKEKAPKKPAASAEIFDIDTGAFVTVGAGPLSIENEPQIYPEKKQAPAPITLAPPAPTVTTKKEKPVKKAAPKKVSADILNLDFGEPEPEKTPEEKAKQLEDLENLKRMRDIAKKHQEELKGSAEKENKRLATFDNLLNRCKFAIRELGYGASESTAMCVEFGPDISKYAKEVADGITTEEVAKSAILNRIKISVKPNQSVDEALAGAPVSTPTPPKAKASAPTDHGGKTNVFDALLSYTCLQVMQNYGQNFDTSLKLCAEREGDIKRLSHLMEKGDLSPLQAAKELSEIIISRTRFTTVKTVHSDVAAKDTSSGMVIADRTARKARVELINATTRAMEKRGLTTELIQGVGKTVPMESQFKIKVNSAAVVVTFNGPKKPPGMTDQDKRQWDKEVFNKYISVLIDEFDINIKTGLGGNYAAYFNATYDQNADVITLEQGGKIFLNFRDTLRAMRARFTEEELFISVDSALFHGWNLPDSPEGDLLKIA